MAKSSPAQIVKSSEAQKQATQKASSKSSAQPTAIPGAAPSSSVEMAPATRTKAGKSASVNNNEKKNVAAEAAPAPRVPSSQAKPVAGKTVIEKTVVEKTATDKPASRLEAAKPVAKPVPAKAEEARPAAVKAPAPLEEAVRSAPAQAPLAKAPVAEAAKPKAPGVHRTGFKSQEFIVYPAHGVGQIVAIEEQEVAGFKLELFVISFAKDKMTLKVPLPKVLAGAIRKLSDGDVVTKSLDTLTGRARVKRTMWSRRAQEYEAKINSGDLIAIAEVVRDLYRSEAQPEQSYSERQLYEAALDRMARELAAVQKLTETESLKLVEQHLERGPKRGTRAEALAEADAEAEAEAEGPDGEIEAAA